MVGNRFVGNNEVIESGSVLLGADDPEFTIKISELTFTIAVVQGPSGHR